MVLHEKRVDFEVHEVDLSNKHDEQEPEKDVPARAGEPEAPQGVATGPSLWGRGISRVAASSSGPEGKQLPQFAQKASSGLACAPQLVQ